MKDEIESIDNSSVGGGGNDAGDIEVPVVV